MAIVKEFGNGLWFHIPRIRRRPDEDVVRFGRSGEFSPWADLAFEKHLAHVNHLRQVSHADFKSLRRDARLWY